MLGHEENELITRVGAGTPMGNLLREFWMPAMLSSELPAPDSDPVRVLLLGEHLIAFRATDGKVGLLAHNCPHRGASLFFGRNEENGLRCVYHGWKFSTSGECVDMPNEPAESDFRTRVKAVSYPTRERGGVIWAYLGPRREPPPLPDLEGNMTPTSAQSVRAFQLRCNWLQVLEGDIDTSHVGFLHYGGLSADDQAPGSFSEYQLRDRTMHFEVIDTDGGAAYGARRQATPGQTYWRVAQWCMPFYSFTPPGVLGTKVGGNCRVPMDDTHTLAFNMASRTNAASSLRPNTSDWYGRFRTEQELSNDFLIDRQMQRQNVGSSGYTGIASVSMQDAAMTAGMGPIFDRSTEHLGTSDAMVIRVRRRLLAAVEAHMKYGTVPMAVDNPEVYGVRSGGVILPDGTDWVAATQHLRQAFVEHRDLDPTLNGAL
ncbi:MAG TPA: Rieske 2Fe-2S domain-containing protein [Chloroflexota bacterium]|jgi:phenylpropionate dioxygenase-like ring-hydroxylating dioxygenase large terminal subunit|nr:Rieske 2Fe-2S domain-containing protein [Chloroflexota bacterium]